MTITCKKYSMKRISSVIRIQHKPENIFLQIEKRVECEIFNVVSRIGEIGCCFLQKRKKETVFYFIVTIE